MNLIEQLGGYEKARDSLQWVIEHDDKYVQDESALYHACLEYRRENNVFEKGDLVVGDRLIDNRIFEFQYYLPELSMAAISKDGAAIGLNQLRHATDKEIAQGYRDE